MSKTCFQNAQKCVFLGVILQNFPGGMPPYPPRIVVPSALPLKLICDVTRVWRNLATPSEIFCVRHGLSLLEKSIIGHPQEKNHSHAREWSKRETSVVEMLLMHLVMLRGVTKWDGARWKKQVSRPIFEHELFWKQIYFLEESACDIFGTFCRPHSDLVPGELCPPCSLVTPLVTLSCLLRCVFCTNCCLPRWSSWSIFWIVTENRLTYWVTTQ